MTETRKGIRQSDFAEKHNLKPGEVKDLREQHLEEGKDYWSVVRAIFWTEEAVSKVESLMTTPLAKKVVGITTAAQQAEPLPDAVEHKELPAVDTPENFSAYVIKPCRNKRFVYASYNGEKISVSVHPRHQLKVVKKSIRVRAEKDGDATKYFHVP